MEGDCQVPGEQCQWVMRDKGQGREECPGQRGNEVTGRPFTGFPAVTSKLGNSSGALLLRKGRGQGLWSLTEVSGRLPPPPVCASVSLSDGPHGGSPPGQAEGRPTHSRFAGASQVLEKGTFLPVLPKSQGAKPDEVFI